MWHLHLNTDRYIPELLCEDIYYSYQPKQIMPYVI